MTFKITSLCIWVVTLAVHLIRVGTKQKPEWFDVFVPVVTILVATAVDIARS